MRAEANEIRVRRLHPDDAPSVARLLDQLGYPGDTADVRRRIEAWADDQRGAVFGASLAEHLVGCTAIHVVPFFERPGARARLVALVVDVGCRRGGIGRMLVERAKEFARRRGAVEIEVTSRRTRTGADRFYTDLGFTDVTGRSRRYIAEV